MEAVGAIDPGLLAFASTVISMFFAGGAVAIYKARPQREHILSAAAKNAVDALQAALDATRTDLLETQNELREARLQWAAEKALLRKQIASLNKKELELRREMDDLRKKLVEKEGVDD